MGFVMGLLGLALAVQIPPPAAESSSAPARGADWNSRRRAVLDHENNALRALADQLERDRNGAAASVVRGLIVRAGDSDALTKFQPLPEVAQADPGADAEAGAPTVGEGPVKPSAPSSGAEPNWKGKLNAIRRESAAQLLDLAQGAAAADPPRWGLASLCVRGALARDPNQPEARRLLGFERHADGWARSFAIRNLRAGNVLHPTYGWVPASWAPRLDSGELPAPSRTRTSNVRWLPAVEADRLRADGNPPWRITTEHFEIRSNVPLSQTIDFGRRLEDFYEFFFAVTADVVGARLPLARRFRDPSLRGETTSLPHLIYYFATKDQYVDHLRRFAPPDVDQSLGYYDPFGPGSKTRKPAYFFLDAGGRIGSTATLYHEVSHQLLFESGLGGSYKRNQGNYWVLEGLGTFFETVAIHPDGSMEVGGFVGPRIAEAVRRLIEPSTAVPTALFVSYDQNTFNLESQIHANYQQAMALTLFLMRGRGGAYREAFLDYVADAVKGRLRLGAGKSLEERLGAPYTRIDDEFLEFLRAGAAVQAAAPEPAAGAG